jgi:CheY-like chemotaxis protein
MRILLIEDDANKADQIMTMLPKLCDAPETEVRRSFQSGLKEAVLGSYDVVLLDMTMPNYDVTQREPGGKERRYAGKEIMRQIARRQKPLPIIIITQYEQFEENGETIKFPELVKLLKTDFPDNFVGAVFYQAGSIAWADELKVLLARSEELK